MNTYNETMHYQARFNLAPTIEDVGPAHRMVREVLWRWLYAKEMRREETSLKNEFVAPDVQGLFLEGGLLLPTGQGAGERSGVITDGFETPDGSAWWAMDLDEPDGETPWRRWHTQVGLEAAPDGRCAVNVHYGHYTPPRYSGEPLARPRANAPRFVKRILDDSDYRASTGPTQLLTSAEYLTAETFDTIFKKSLLDPCRELPLVLMCTDWNGRTPVWDEAELAEDGLLGMANVYVADWRDPGTREQTDRLFRCDEPSYRYRCGMWELRVYRAGVDLSNAGACSEHPLYQSDRIESICRAPSGERDPGRFVDALARMLVADIPRRDSDVLGPDDVARARSRERVRELEESLERARASASDAERPARAAAPEDDPQEWEKLARELEKDRDLHMEYALLLEKALDQANGKANDSESRNRQLEADLRYARFRIEQESARADAAEDECRTLRRAGEVMEGLDHVPGTLVDLLHLVEDLWGERIRVTDEAWKSAEEYRNGDLDEEWRILKSVPTVLWDIYFNEKDTEGWEPRLYRDATGFELAVTESGATKANREFMREREISYKGGTVEAAAHIKGTSKRAGAKNLFRLHYYVDWDDKVIVIGHCGGHLTTAGTRRI